MTEDSKQSAPAKNLLDTALEHPKEVSELVNGIASAIVDSLVKLNETKNRHERRLAYLIAGLLALIIIAGAALTWSGRLDPAAFGFLVGPIVGGLLTYLIESLSPAPSLLDIG